VIEVLSRRVRERGAPLYLRSDNGPEFVSRALLKWIVDQGIGTALIDPGKPWQNGATESLIGKFRDECLSLEWFRSRTEAKVVIEGWWRHYNEVRPHSSLGYLTPAEFVAKIGSQDAASRPATGRIAAVCGASALQPVASPPPQGASEGSTEGRVLKLSEARRIRSGQPVLRLAGHFDSRFKTPTDSAAPSIVIKYKSTIGSGDSLLNDAKHLRADATIARQGQARGTHFSRVRCPCRQA